MSSFSVIAFQIMSLCVLNITQNAFMYFPAVLYEVSLCSILYLYTVYKIIHQVVITHVVREN